MGAPVFSVDDFADALIGLLPRGRVWPRDPDTTIRSTMLGLAPSYVRLQTRGNNLLVDGFPASTIELLPEWEASLGLPDPCAGASPTVEARRAQVVARFSNSGGQSVPYFIAYALALGYTITVAEFAPFRVGFSTVGTPLYGADWAHTWAIQAALNQVQYFMAGISAVGEPLAYWSNAVLECELLAIKPAHTVLFFQYS